MLFTSLFWKKLQFGPVEEEWLQSHRAIQDWELKPGPNTRQQHTSFEKVSHDRWVVGDLACSEIWASEDWVIVDGVTIIRLKNEVPRIP